MPKEPPTPTDQDEERTARIKDAQLRGAKTRRLKTEERVLNAFLELGRVDNPDEKITVADICRQASHMSQATFYGRFPGGTGDLLVTAAKQLRDNVTKRIKRDLEASRAPTLQSDRVAIAIARLVEQLLEYPNLFNVDRIIPRAAIYALAETLFDAIVGGTRPSKKEREWATVIAKYHATSLVGILRTGLGEDIDRSDFVVVLAQRSVSQVLPVLLGDRTATRQAETAIARLLRPDSVPAHRHKQTQLRP